ncbi:hypothetical protein [Roseivivax sp. CAU 1761]
MSSILTAVALVAALIFSLRAAVPPQEATVPAGLHPAAAEAPAAPRRAAGLAL